jgi:hypothetical protein
VVAVITSSVYWLGASLVFDVAIGGYVTMLLSIRQRGAPRGSVVRLPVTESPVQSLDQPVVEETPTVRVIAG